MTKSILIIDKDPFIQIAFKRILNLNKISVLTAYSIQQAEQKHGKKEPLLIMFDADYNTINTDNLLKIRKIFPNTPVMLMTAFSNTITYKVSREMGADFYMTKPFNIPEMLQKVFKLLENQDKLNLQGNE